jgi:hypothetical protein
MTTAVSFRSIDKRIKVEIFVGQKHSISESNCQKASTKENFINVKLIIPFIKTPFACQSTLIDLKPRIMPTKGNILFDFMQEKKFQNIALGVFA